MALEFKFPDVGEGIVEGEILKWHVKEGDEIKEDQIMVEVETDKAVVEIPSPRDGVVLKILAKEGEVVKVGQVMIVIGERGEKWKEEISEIPRPISVGVVGELEEAPEERISAMPAVRALAKKLRVDIAKVKGTGPAGRITEEDVKKYAEKMEKLPEKVVEDYDKYGRVEKVSLKGIRRSMAKRMVEAKLVAPHAAGMDEADMTELVRIREREKEAAAKKGINLTYLPFFMKAVVAGLEQYSYLNATLDEENELIILKKYYNISVAIDTEEGLIVPVIRDVDKKSIIDIAKELQELIQKAKTRKIELADLRGGSFCISDYGAIGCTYGTPIINYPEVAILGIGKIQDKPVVRDGQIVIRKMVGLSLSFDHRVVDGAQAARFLNLVIRYLEDPGLILLEA